MVGDQYVKARLRGRVVLLHQTGNKGNHNGGKKQIN